MSRSGRKCSGEESYTWNIKEEMLLEITSKFSSVKTSP